MSELLHFTTTDADRSATEPLRDDIRLLGGLLGDAAGYGAALVVAGAALLVVAAASLATGVRDARLGDQHTSGAGAG